MEGRGRVDGSSAVPTRNSDEDNGVVFGSNDFGSTWVALILLFLAPHSFLFLPLSPLSLGLGVRWMATRWRRGTGTHLGNRGWGFYSQSSARHGASGWGWPRGAQRAMIASRLGLRGRNAAAGTMAKPFSCSLVSKAGDREATRSRLGHGHGRHARGGGRVMLWA